LKYELKDVSETKAFSSFYERLKRVKEFEEKNKDTSEGLDITPESPVRRVFLFKKRLSYLPSCQS